MAASTAMTMAAQIVAALCLMLIYSWLLTLVFLAVVASLPAS